MPTSLRALQGVVIHYNLLTLLGKFNALIKLKLCVLETTMILLYNYLFWEWHGIRFRLLNITLTFLLGCLKNFFRRYDLYYLTKIRVMDGERRF